MENRVPDDMIARAQNGSPADTGNLYSRHYLSIYRYLYYRTGDAMTAEDLTSEVFLKMVRALPSYRIGNVPFQAWLFQIARNMAIDHYRRNQHYPLVELDENLDGNEPNLDSMIDFHFTSVDLAEGLKKSKKPNAMYWCCVSSKAWRSTRPHLFCIRAWMP